MSLSQNTQMEFFDGDFVMNFLQQSEDDKLLYTGPLLFPPGCGKNTCDTDLRCTCDPSQNC